MINNITFASKFDSILCLDGDPPPKEIFKKMDGIEIFAADGAGVKLHTIGINAHHIIGDLDSYYSDPLHKKIAEPNLIYMPDQEHNDFEKALVYISESGFNNTLITGFHGGILEHSFNNWSVFMRYSSNMNLCILDKDRYCFSVSEELQMKCESDEIISIIPQPSAILKTSGLKWELDMEELKLGSREGARNQAIAEEISIKVSSGDILFCCNSRLPFSPFNKID